MDDFELFLFTVMFEMFVIQLVVYDTLFFLH